MALSFVPGMLAYDGWETGCFAIGGEVQSWSRKNAAEYAFKKATGRSPRGRTKRGDGNWG
ncbi:hypothetical protein CLAFUW4_01791 [Fulvia fulva]|uniref:Uncharacterized protein n=1 Tax=Passalora fulva TaxID=5499 RepID=A0A9Q8L5I3_PASFU|nr:uncharacterized protein CLAFUR5_01787 [Fulvia fulva]KAK4635450.1 hypothetical protein CLAFUR4_01789 [Fulvia fulva]KAK4638199.1 hypothetical protein CLAFUR0_01791 [Fulvia fulva]UJO11242.1 hypothetical protein CLAFUR5_01787 [Fulvia fulva]WPV10118.1 hypothetical protein CLAFUW4_01791 [Fulvia fulva]WPV25258.1 hypothetical protein CLAFUW7_01792 [Fulvia fulva]